MDIKQLDLKARHVAKNYKKLEAELLELIIQIDQNKIFYKLGFNSLFKYLTEALELSPAMACAFTNVARKSQEVPELKSQVVSGSLSIYKAQRITSILTQENSKQWLMLASQKNHRELEREVALTSPHKTIKETSTYKPANFERKEKVTVKRDSPRLELRLGVSETLMLKLKRAQDLESQKSKKNLNLEETLNEVVSVYLEKRDPLKKAERLREKEKLKDSVSKKCRSVDKNRARARRRQALPARLRHQIQLRDQSQCTHIGPNGRRCDARRYLEVHHIRPLSMGGDNSLKNLTLLCSGHHKSIHFQSNERP